MLIKTLKNTLSCKQLYKSILLVDIMSTEQDLDSLKFLIHSNPFSPLFVNDVKIPHKEQTIGIMSKLSNCLYKNKFNFIELIWS